LISLGLLLVAGWIALHFVPLPESLFAGPISQMEILDRTGKPLRVVRPGENPFARPLRYAEIPQPLIEATLAAEDRRFWKHHGVDPRATLRAMWQWARHRRVISGGSTITQQLIKLAQPRPRTLRTKIVEALQAMRLEQVWSKQQILSEYLNRLDYGNFNRGPAAAAQLYFAKPLHDLTPAECALLAALPQAPARLNPYSHFDRARKRQQWILRGMQNAGWLTDHELRRALDEPVQIARTRRVFEAPHFVDLLLATHRFTPKQPVRTTLDLELNHFSEMVLRRHLSGLRAQHVSNGALVILDNRSGDVLALVGSEDFFSPAAGQVNGAWAPRSPGSAFKPFTYLLALEHGDTPSTVVADVPTEFPTATGLFAPANYNRHCYGPMRYRLALANSLNISAVKVLASIGGPEPLQRLLQQCGLTTLNRSAEDYGLGLTLGNAEARLIELANAYACLARLGQFRPYRLVVAPDRDGSAMPARRIADASAAYLIADILSDNDARTPAFGSESALRFEFPVACKTGTSSDFRDNWAFGYTPEFTVGVWIGNPDNSPMQHVSGVTGAGPILHELFDHLHEQFGTTWYSQPANIVECRIHPITGKRLSESSAQRTSDAIAERFVAGNLPPLESSDDYESGSTRIVRLGSEYREWFGTGDNWLGDRAVPADAEKSLRVLFPPPGTTLYLDADLPAQGRRMVLRAAGSKAVDWRSDSLRIERNGIRDIAWLVEGKHEISVRDPVSGKEARTWVVVRAR
jgi:penicillin-binding protein 1C